MIDLRHKIKRRAVQTRVSDSEEGSAVLATGEELASPERVCERTDQESEREGETDRDGETMDEDVLEIHVEEHFV